MGKEGFIELNINGWQDLKELVTWVIKDARLQKDALDTPIIALTLGHPLSEKDYTMVGFIEPIGQAEATEG